MGDTREGEEGSLDVKAALASILEQHLGFAHSPRRIVPVDATRLALEAETLRKAEPVSLRSEGALHILEAARSMPGVAERDCSAIEQFVAKSLIQTWPGNADELAKAVLARPRQATSVIRLLPPDLASHPHLTAKVSSSLTSGLHVSSELLSLAQVLRFDEEQTRALLHHWTRQPDGLLKGMISGIIERCSASQEWRRVQQACLAESCLNEPQDELVRYLDCLPLRWRRTASTFDLLASTPEVREAWSGRLVKLAAEGTDLFDALLEGVLWHGQERADDLVLLLGAALCSAAKDGGRRTLGKLAGHPSQAVVLRVAALERQAVDVPVEPDRPAPSGILDAASRIALLVHRRRSSPATWIGDRKVETAVEDAIRLAAAKFVGSYEAHWREDEEPLTVKLLGEVRAALAQVQHDLEIIARTGPGSRRIAFSLRDRIVPKVEEGRDGTVPDSAFATDVCLIMTARRDGKVLASRATLVQVKKLKKDKGGRWKPSFEVDQAQLRALSKQTAAAFYLLLCPEEGGRSIPVMPAQLVSDHLPRGGRTRRLHRDDVSRASRGLARWLTYDVIGLWCGDPKVSLLRKVAGDEGRRPYLLLEVDVAISSRKDD